MPDTFERWMNGGKMKKAEIKDGKLVFPKTEASDAVWEGPAETHGRKTLGRRERIIPRVSDDEDLSDMESEQKEQRQRESR